MRNKTLFGFVVILILTFGIFAACNKDDKANAVVNYTGNVVYIGSSVPFADVEVKVTDGRNIHRSGKTDENGLFSLRTVLNEIDENYYILVGDSSCIQQKITIPCYGQAIVDLGTVEIEGPTIPMVETQAVTSVTANSAVSGGRITFDGRLPITARGVCYSKSEYPTADGMHTTDGTGKGEFTSNLKDLEFKGTYYVRAYATNRLGTGYGEQMKFTTEPGVAVVVTDSVYRITAHNARCKAHVVSDGGFPVTKRGICWSTKPDPSIDDDVTDDGSDLGEYSGSLKDLIENTTYYIRAYATNSTSTVYGEQMIISTPDGLAVVKTDSVGSVAASSFVAYGKVVSDCDVPVTIRGFCCSTMQYPTINDKVVVVGKGLGSYQIALSNLEYGTTYYVRAYATNATETSYSEQVSVTTKSGLPTVQTAQVSNIGSVKAVCGGTVTDDGTLTVIARGICWSTQSDPTIEDSHTTDGKGKGEFKSNLKELQDKTEYYVRAYATTSAGTAYGEQRTFTTEDGVPVVELTELKDTTSTSIIAVGNVTGDGGLTVTARGFCYGTAQYPTIDNAIVSLGTGTGEFTGSLSELEKSTKYYIRAYATNSIGTSYSKQMSFTTLSGLPILTTTVGSSTAVSIVAGGNIISNGGYAVTNRGVCYSASNSEPTLADKFVVSGSGNGDFSTTIAELQANTTYYVRAYATNSIGTAYGNAVTITTQDGKATLTTADITNITALSATGGVTVSATGGAELTECGICWATTQNPTIENDKSGITTTQVGSYSCNMSQLKPNTTYYVRAYATTNITIEYGNQVSFNTADGLATLTTGVTTATSTVISSGGSISSDGGYTITTRGVCYSTTNSNPTIEDAFVTNGSGIGSYTCNITSIDVSTIYYVRAFATNSIGTAYGEVISITTKDGLPIVNVTDPKDNITAITINTGGNVVSDEGYAVTSRGVVYSTLPYPTLETASSVTSGNGTGYYSSQITSVDLTNSSYYIRAFATNANGTSYSEQIIITPERLKYSQLPTITYAGYKYHISDDLGRFMPRYEALALCKEYSLGGYADWILPTEDEMTYIFQAKIGGWHTSGTFSSGIEERSSQYWTSTINSEHDYIIGYTMINNLGYSNGQVSFVSTYTPSVTCRVRLVRRDKIE